MALMMKFCSIIKKKFSGWGSVNLEEMEKLRLDFKERYAYFKQLISANNKALEIMADIERTLKGERPFGMSFVRSSATMVSANVFQMVMKLQLLAPGKYNELTRRHDDIENKINRILNEKRTIWDAPIVIPLGNIDKDLADLVGGKMANLGEIKNNIGLNVPSGFVITSSAYEQFVDHNNLSVEIARQMQLADLDDIENLYELQARLHQLIVESEIPREIEDAISDAWRKMEAEAGSGVTVAMRSSALGEDEEGSTFAGLHLSELNVSADQVFDSYKQIVSSKYSLQAITYRLNKGIKDEDIAMCVGCQVMVNAVSGGVIYSRSPIDIHDDSAFINATWGLPKAVVDGSVDSDLFVVSREQPLKPIYQEIKEKNKKFVCDSLEGVCRVDLTEDDVRNQPSITEQQAIALAQMAIRIEDHYGAPQDIEWAISKKGEIHILQSRPLLQMESLNQDLSEGFKAKQKETVILKGGFTASPGTAFGVVRTVDSGLDMLEFPEGAILLAREAHPRLASLLSRASGVISEHGSFAGHLANVAREFELPALFGISGVLDKLNNDDQVTLDATGRSIHKGCVEYLLNKSKPRNRLMIGSPVHETLKAVSRHIIPLNLLEPDDPGFAPENCMTFHDITRFIHEKSVYEMFRFGEDRNFAERSSKQLHYHVPMKWWILNLDDGFVEEVRGKFVKLENIASIPMLAFWEGFVAIPWDGPPPLDGKGFMSVMFQSTNSTAMTPGVRPKYADRNYFMISKNYCNLSSRIGYHFTTLEALVSDQRAENFISFQFKGGAADSNRRFIRVNFIKMILEEYGFRVETKKDNLISWVEGHEKAYMLERIKVLGYLTLHTRQIDMIMTNSDKVSYYRSKIKKDIGKIITAPTVTGSS